MSPRGSQALRVLRTVVLVVCVLVPVAGLRAQVAMVHPPNEGMRYWPCWRGPSGQGHALDAGYPDRWSASQNVLWRVSVTGRGNSSPIIWGDRIFLTTAHDDGTRRSILCLRRSDGALLWEAEAPRTEPESFHRKNGAASSTPTTDGERVYAYFGNHGLIAVDFSGRTVWHRSLGEVDAYHGTASSPLLHDGKVIVAQDHQGSSFIAAFDAATGEELWRASRSAQVGWNSPIAVHVGDHVEIVLSGQQSVQAYDARTGEELWHARGSTFEAIPTPVVGHGLIFVSSGRDGPTLAIRPGGSGDVTATNVIWKVSHGSPFFPSAALLEGRLYLVNDMTSEVSAYDARTGKLLWQGQLGDARREGFSSSPVVVGKQIFFTNDGGETFVIESGDQFRLLHVNRLGEQVIASPALVDGIWYFRTAGHLLAIGSVPSKRTALD